SCPATAGRCGRPSRTAPARSTSTSGRGAWRSTTTPYGCSPHRTSATCSTTPNVPTSALPCCSPHHLEDHDDCSNRGPTTDRHARGRCRGPRRARLCTASQPKPGQLLLVRRRLQLHLDPHGDVPAVRLRLQLRRTAVLLVLDRRPRGPVLRRVD